MTMMATQDATDPSVLLNHNASKDTVAVDDDDDRSDEIASPPPIHDVKSSRRLENGSNNNTIMSMTPPRSSLASDPNLTPIASIKRPRANLPRTNSASNRSAAMLMSPTTPNDAAITRRAASTPLSPMHKIKPVLHREDHSPTGGEAPIKDKVDELFSPVVQFLHEDHHSSQENEHTEEGSEVEDDVSMTRPEQHDGTDGEFNPWQFIASLPPYDTVKAQRPPITLPPQAADDTRKTLVLDLDETLVHCSVVEPTDRVADFTFPVQFHGETYTVHVKCRPFLQEFLHNISQHFEVIVFTASQKVYADALLNILDPNTQFIHHRLFRESCLAVEGNYLKDLNVLGRDLSRTVLVDNSPHAFGYQVSNGIPIESWFDCPDDRELLKLQRFLLQQVLPAPDVRLPVRNKFQSHILIATAPPFALLH